MYSNIEEAWKISNDLDKYRNNNIPATNVKNATNEITEINLKTTENNRSDKMSTPSSSIFKTELRDLKKLVKQDDGKQCQKLFSHFQVCQKCRNKIVEKFSLNTAEQPSIMKFTENFIDFTKYTDVLNNKNYSNITSIILFGLLVIIILSMISNGKK